MPEVNNKASIEALKHEERYTWGESDYGKAYVYRIWDWYILFEIPQYGGPGIFSGAYPLFRIDDLIDEVKSWT
jgi:hypothetical protein